MQKVILFSCLVCIITASCCKKKQLIPLINIQYQNLDKGTEIILKSYFSKDSFIISQPDFILNDTAVFPYRLALSHKFSSYVIDAYSNDVENDTVIRIPLFSDSISDISFELGGRCDQKLKKLSYRFNGTLKSATTIVK